MEKRYEYPRAFARGEMRATRSTRFPYLACEDPTQANDDQNVEDGRANDRTDPDVSLGDEHT